jgi:hypothetical protein
MIKKSVHFVQTNSNRFKPFFDLLQTINLSYFIIAVYFILSVLFAFERILNIDCTFFFFNIVNYKTFFIPENRFGIFFSQIPLIIAARIGLSLNSLVYIYSITFPLFYLFIIWICNTILKVKQAALLASLSLIIGVAYSFYHPVTETYHALIYSALFLGLIISNEVKKINSFSAISLIILIEIFALISHPISVFTCSFIIVYCFLNKEINYKKGLFLLLFPILSIALRLILVDEKSYDNKQYDHLFASLQSFQNFFTLYPVSYLTSRLLSLYFAPLIIVIYTFIVLIFNKKYWLFTFTLLASSAYFLIAVFTFGDGDGNTMMEKTFMPFLFMYLIPLTGLFYNSIKKIKLQHSLVIVFITVVSFAGILKASFVHTKRLEKLTETLSKTDYPKTIYNYSDLGESITKFNNWGTGIETLILADCKLNKSATIFLVDNKLKFEYNNKDSSLFLNVTWWPNWKINQLDTNYFKVSNLPYRLY